MDISVGKRFFVALTGKVTDQVVVMIHDTGLTHIPHQNRDMFIHGAKAQMENWGMVKMLLN